MRARPFAVLAAASLASGQSIQQLVGQLPSCSLGCLEQYIPQVCPINDHACQCQPSNASYLRSLLTPCVVSHCTTQEALQVVAISDEICAKVALSSQFGSAVPSSTAFAGGRATVATTGGLISATPTSGGTSTQPAASPSSSSSPSSSLSTGAIAGIAVGGAVVIAVIAVLIWLLLRQRRRNQKPSEPAAPHEDGLSPAPGLAPGAGAPSKEMEVVAAGQSKTPAVTMQQQQQQPFGANPNRLAPPTGRPELYTPPPSDPRTELPAYQYPNQGPGELHGQYVRPHHEMYGGTVPHQHQPPSELPADGTYAARQQQNQGGWQ